MYICTMPLDITIYESGDGGDLRLENDDLITINGFTGQVYLALFGGNYLQSTSDDLDELDERFDWWGNEYLEEELQFNSTFERTINQIVLNTAGISKLVDAADQDLDYLKQYADITIEGSIPEYNRFQLDVTLQQPDGLSTKIKFVWDGTKNELIVQEII